MAAQPDKLAQPDKTLRVLLVEDSPDDAELLVRELNRAGYTLDMVRVQTGDEMSAALRERGWDIVISDHSLPRFSAPEAFKLLRETGIDLPFIIVSGTVGEEVAVNAMRSGVQDYILKGNMRRLVVAIERELREAAMRAEQRKTRDQLLVSERMASVGTLAAGVAHEINNPLSVVIGNLDCIATSAAQLTEALDGLSGTARAKEVLAELREPLADAHEAAERVRVIVRDLRILSRADEETRAPTDVRKVLDSSLRMARNEIRHRAEVVRRYEDVPLVNANQARLGQVFLNLLVNAAQALPEGKTNANAVTLTTRAANGAVVVEISDTGTGIPPEVLPRIFDIFFTTKPIGVGTGLGLAICHRIVTGMGGSITVESKVGAGSGTTFRVTLPVARSQDAPEVTPMRPPETGGARRAAVLVIDDEQSVGRVLQRLLASAHDATLVLSAREALARLEAGGRFDVVLCDLMMPEMTGIDFYEAVSRRHPELARRIVFMTGGAFTPRAREFLDRVQNKRLDKPVDPARLRQIVDQVLGS